MKILIILAAFLITACQVLSQGPVMEWHEGFGTEYEEHVHEGFQTKDGGFLGVGQTWEGYSDFMDVLVVKADSAGNLEWQVIIGTPQESDIGICALEAGDGFYIGGGLYSAIEERQMRGLVRLDQDGNVVWKRTYPGTRNGAIRGIDSAFDGNLISTGYTGCLEAGFVFIADEADGFAMKTDQKGSIIWDKSISAPQGTKIREEHDSTIAIASTKWIYSGGDYQNVVLIKTDTAGNETWTRSYGGKNRNQCFDFDLTRDGGYIFAGHTRGYDVENWDYLLLKVDAEGNEEWVNTFGQPRGYNPEFIHDESYGVRQTPDGGFIIAGGSGDEYAYSECGHPSGCSDEWKAYLVKTDSLGNRLWEGVFPTASVGNNAAEYIGLTDDGGYIVFTDTDSESPPAPNNFGFMKLASDTITVFNPITPIPGMEGRFDLFPNPASDRIILNRNFEMVNVYSITGQEILTVSDFQANHEINLEHLVNGIFLVKVSDEGQEFTKKLIIIKN